jgi:ABC-2 type transport system permease protein
MRLFQGMKNQSKRAGIVLIAVICVAIAIGLSLLADSLEKKYALRLDLSYNRVTTQSDATDEVLASLPYAVHAYALFTPGNEDQALLGLLNRMAAKTDKFTYSVDSLVKNPLLASQLSSDLRDQAISADSLLIICEETKRKRVLDITDYVSQSFDTASQTFYISGFQYEKKIAEALVYVTTSQVPKVQVLEGHGELGAGQTAAMEELLTAHNYAFERVDLMRAGTLDPAYPLMILSPQKDLLAGELFAIEGFSQKGGSLIITSDYGDPDSLSNFDALYRSYGFEKIPGIVVADEEDKASYINSPIFLTPYMEDTYMTADLVASGHTMLMLPGARAFELPEAQGANPLVTPLLTSGVAYIKDTKKEGATLLPEAGDRQGTFHLALFSSLAQPDGTRTQALILGNSAMLTDSWLYENTYSREFLLHALSYLGHGNNISLDIAPKTATRPQLVMPGLGLPLAIIILMPLLILATGAAVLLMRRRR